MSLPCLQPHPCHACLATARGVRSVQRVQAGVEGGREGGGIRSISSERREGRTIFWCGGRLDGSSRKALGGGGDGGGGAGSRGLCDVEGVGWVR